MDADRFSRIWAFDRFWSVRMHPCYILLSWATKEQICLVERFCQIQKLVWDMKIPDTVHPDTISDCQQDTQGCIFDEVRGVADRQVCSACSGRAVYWDLQTWSYHLKSHTSLVEVQSHATNVQYVCSKISFGGIPNSWVSVS